MWSCKRPFRLFSVFIIFVMNKVLVLSLERYAVIPAIKDDIDIKSIKKSALKETNRNSPDVLIIYLPEISKEQDTFKDIQNVENKFVLKKEVGQSILRDAYIDACLKVVIKKCYKTLLNVKKKVCEYHLRCKSDFKSDFAKNARIGCINEFDYSHLLNSANKNNKSKKNIKYRVKFKDATRSAKFLDACVPYMARKLMSKHKNMMVLNKKLTTHIFRNSYSKYERECSKISENKCINACNYAKDKACDTHDCGRRRIKAFNQGCKAECKNAYRMIRDSRSTESGSSDTD